MVSTFSCTCWPAVCLLWGKCLFGSSALFQAHCFGLLCCVLFWVLSWVSSSCTCGSWLTRSLIPRRFLPLGRRSFVSLMVFFAVRHLAIWRPPKPWLWSQVQKLLDETGVKQLPACFLPGVSWFRVSRSSLPLVHLERTHVCAVWERPSFLHLPVAVQCSQHHLLKRLSFPVVWSRLLCRRFTDHICTRLFLGCLANSTDLCVYFYANALLFGLLRSVI